MERPQAGAEIRRVLMISSLWPPAVLGGAETYAAALAEQLRTRGTEVAAVTLGVPGPDVATAVRAWPYRLDRYTEQTLPRRTVFHLLDLYRPDASRAIRRAIEDVRPDVVHTHSVAGLSSAALAIAGRAEVGHVHTLHDYWLLCRRATLVKRGGSACVTRCVSCRAVSGIRNRVVARHPPDVVLAVSRAVAAEHGDVAWMRGRVRIAPNPVVRTPRRRGTSGGPTFGFLGRLTREKGVETVIDAFASARLPASARLVIGGDGPLARTLGERLPDRVQLAGWLDDGAREAFYERIDALVVPSRWKDPAPLVVNEARARGIPVIGAMIGGIPDLIAPSSRPLLFRSGDRGDLADKLAAFAASPEAYAPPPDDAPPDWDAHIALVTAAYTDARRRAGSRRP
jgi:glycogen synthase